MSVNASGAIVLTGNFNGSVNFGGGALASPGPDSDDVFLAKLDGNNGNHLWSQRFGDISDQIGVAVAMDSAGNALLTGIIYGTTDFDGVPLVSAGGSDVFVAKFGP